MDNDRQDIFSKIREFLHSEGFRRDKISEQTLLYHDLGVRGLDAYELIQFLADEFGIDFDGFDFDAYFPDDFFTLGDFIRIFTRGRDSGRKPLSVGHLIGVCVAKKWLPPTK